MNITCGYVRVGKLFNYIVIIIAIIYVIFNHIATLYCKYHPILLIIITCIIIIHKLAFINLIEAVC